MYTCVHELTFQTHSIAHILIDPCTHTHTHIVFDHITFIIKNHGVRSKLRLVKYCKYIIYIMHMFTYHSLVTLILARYVTAYSLITRADIF